jgi:hypothetical protein
VPTLRKFLIHIGSSQSYTVFSHVHWHLYCIKTNDGEPERIRKYFESIYDEFMLTVKKKNPRIAEEHNRTFHLRDKLMEVSDILKEDTQKVDQKTKVMK